MYAPIVLTLFFIDSGDKRLASFIVFTTNAVVGLGSGVTVVVVAVVFLQCNPVKVSSHVFAITPSYVVPTFKILLSVYKTVRLQLSDHH